MEMTPFFFGLYKFVKYGVYPFTWIVGLFAVVLILAWLPSSPRRLRWLRLSATTGFLLLCLVSSPLVSETLMAILEGWHPSRPSTVGKKPDAIVVLGGGIKDTGTLRPTIELYDESRLRTLCGADLFLQNMAPSLLLTGGNASIFTAGPVEADAMKEWAMRLGVPATAIVTEDRSRTTFENARNSKRILGGRTSIVLVTSAYHIPRATALFEKQGFQVTPYPCGFHSQDRPMNGLNHLNLFDFLPSLWALNRISDVVEETAGMLVYRLAGKI